MFSEIDQSELDGLLKAKASLFNASKDSGKKYGTMIKDLTRQFTQAFVGEDPMRGEGATKSGEDD